MHKRAAKKHRSARRRVGAAGLERLEDRRVFSAGSLDPTFAGTGVAQLVYPGGAAYQTAVVVQPDQKIVSAGLAILPSGVYGTVRVSRFNPDGSLDPTFGTDGFANVLAGKYILDVTGESLTADGKIIVSGTYGGYGGYLVELNADGSLNTNFGSGGFVGSLGQSVDGIAVQPDGKIVATVGFNLIDPENNQFQLERFDSDGSLDSSFGQAGVVNLPAGLDGDAFSIAANGDIYVAGGSPDGFAAHEYNSSGHAVATVDVALADQEYVSHVTIDDAGDIMVAGIAIPTGTSSLLPFFARFNPSLQLDTTFGANGVTIVGQQGSVAGLTPVADGNYVVALGNFTLMELTSDGQLDPSFGDGGIESTGLGTPPPGAYFSAGAMAIQQNGDLVVVGSAITDFFDAVGQVRGSSAIRRG